MCARLRRERLRGQRPRSAIILAAYTFARRPRNHVDINQEEGKFREGLDAFNRLHFFEAHEHWEEVWLETPAPEKALLQGLIQIAAGFHHHTRANEQGARNLLRAGLAKLDLAPPVYRGLELGPLRQAVRNWLTWLEAGNIPERTEFPSISVRAENRNRA